MKKILSRLLLVSILLIGFSVIFPLITRAAVLLSDDFAGTIVGYTNWYIPTWTSSTDGTYLGRTQLRCTQSSSLPAASNSNAIIAVQSYNPSGFSFYGTEIISKQSFSVGQGIDITVRAKMDKSTAGVVGGIFLYSLKPGSSTLHDEIDYELLTSVTNQVQTNIYGNEPLGAGHTQFVSYASGSVTDYHTYEIKWLPTQVSWYLDGSLVRTDTTHVPAGPMNFYLNAWVPDSGWAQAYSAAIQPVTSATANQVFSMNVDSVNIQSIVAAPVLKTITIAPLTVNLTAGGINQQLAATTLDQYGSAIATTLTWASSNPAAATVSSTGLVTPVAAGTANITATSGLITSTAPSVVTVIRAPAVLKTITLSPLTSTLNVGSATQQITATTLDQYGSVIAATLTWTSSNKAVATVSSTGLVTPIAAGTTNITATSGSITSTAPSVVTVTKITPVLKTITLAPLATSLTIGATQQITVTAFDQFGSPIVVTLIPCLNGAGPLLLGQSYCNNSVSQLAPAAPGTIIGFPSATINSGTSLQSLISGAPVITSATPVVTLTSSNKSVATVSAMGLVTAIGAGTTNITATSGSITSTAPSVVTVVAPGIAITNTPILGQAGNAVGSVSNIAPLNYSKYAVAVFIKVAGGWWNKPTWAAPLATIQSNGTWTTNITTGGSDVNATEIRAYLVSATLSVPLVGGQTSLPSTLSPFPYAVVTR